MGTKVGNWLEQLGANRAGLLLLLAALVLGWGGGIATVAWARAFTELPSQMAEVQSWQAAHDSVVTEPGLLAIETNTVNIRNLSDDIAVIRRQVTELYCDRWPERCEYAPGSGRGDGE